MSVTIKPQKAYLKHVAVCNVLNIKQRSHKTNSLLSSNHSVGETPAPIVSEPQGHVQCTLESTGLRGSFWGLLIYHVIWGFKTPSNVKLQFNPSNKNRGSQVPLCGFGS